MIYIQFWLNAIMILSFYSFELSRSSNIWYKQGQSSWFLIFFESLPNLASNLTQRSNLINVYTIKWMLMPENIFWVWCKKRWQCCCGGKTYRVWTVKEWVSLTLIIIYWYSVSFLVSFEQTFATMNERIWI